MGRMVTSCTLHPFPLHLLRALRYLLLAQRRFCGTLVWHIPSTRFQNALNEISSFRSPDRVGVKCFTSDQAPFLICPTGGERASKFEYKGAIKLI